MDEVETLLHSPQEHGSQPVFPARAAPLPHVPGQYEPRCARALMPSPAPPQHALQAHVLVRAPAPRQVESERGDEAGGGGRAGAAAREQAHAEHAVREKLERVGEREQVYVPYVFKGEEGYSSSLSCSSSRQSRGKKRDL
eukprot:748497-Hanusia_phi.AAC.1